MISVLVACTTLPSANQNNPLFQLILARPMERLCEEFFAAVPDAPNAKPQEQFKFDFLARNPIKPYTGFQTSCFYPDGSNVEPLSKTVSLKTEPRNQPSLSAIDPYPILGCRIFNFPSLQVLLPHMAKIPNCRVLALEPFVSLTKS